MRKLTENLTLRRILLPVLHIAGNFDITIRHQLAGVPMRVHVYRHKGYWFHGSRRESDTIRFVQRTLQPGQTAIDVGAHIGYFTLLFSHIVGEQGRIVAFEPGENNFPYLKANVRRLKNVTVVTKAVSDFCGQAEFVLEDITGQNNSLIRNYYGFEYTRAAAPGVPIQQKVVRVEAVTLDEYCSEAGYVPDFLKIDVEGAEWMALKGMHNLLHSNPPVMIIEVTSHQREVLDSLRSAGYVLFRSDGSSVTDVASLTVNVHCLHGEKHRNLLPMMGQPPS